MLDRRKHRKIKKGEFFARWREQADRYRESINGTQEAGAGTLLVEQAGGSASGGDGGGERPVGTEEKPHEEAAQKHDVEVPREKAPRKRRKTNNAGG